ncbi:ganglioside-induced differentiation-associated protein 1 [Culex quinquefasciatus]|uniref:Ganglioside-induced differentiation-associated protein 1 n=1 Tax=Culex quinquefasciatus TaxID=7176 RepID=B0WR16_CULQU|nr:ganglioside-induced differentiation-associated protein 1 [Culex quinquefasciatus]|eukprot:XP_001851150.1 ganglioside-induced differentiation-associated protein 1 [Culex quinquefasciatus]
MRTHTHTVLWALAEKDIQFTKYEVDVANDEHFSEWFLELNPRGELPVLQKGLMIVPGSGRILDFLEEKFPASKSLRLPLTADKKLASLKTTLDKLPIGVLTVGSFLHPNSVVSPKSPFVQPVRYTILERDESVSSRLRSYAESFPAFSNVLLKKAEFHERKREVLASSQYYASLLAGIDDFLAEVETLLAKVSTTEWIAGDSCTLVDIGLGCLLYRLYVLGLEDRFWTGGKKPALEKYFRRILPSDNFQSTLPTKTTLLKTIWLNTPSTYKAGIAAFSFSSMIIGSTLLKR